MTEIATTGEAPNFPEFQIGDYVEKWTGDYRAPGCVIGVFDVNACLGTHHKCWRFVVRHEAQGGGYFCHIYSAKNLRLTEGKP